MILFPNKGWYNPLSLFRLNLLPFPLQTSDVVVVIKEMYRIYEIIKVLGDISEIRIKLKFSLLYDKTRNAGCNIMSAPSLINV